MLWCDSVGSLGKPADVSTLITTIILMLWSNAVNPTTHHGVPTTQAALWLAHLLEASPDAKEEACKTKAAEVSECHVLRQFDG